MRLNTGPSPVQTVSSRGACGYRHPNYASAFLDYGRPQELPLSQGWVIRRNIPGTDYDDAMGCYPLFACGDWSRLHGDVENLSRDLVTLSIVTDPFGNYDDKDLSRIFPDLCRPYKQHYVADLSRSPASYVSDHHKRNARKAFERIQVGICGDLMKYFEDWNTLYGNLIKRHDIVGMTTFSKESFQKQFQVPGMVALRAAEDDTTIGMLLWYNDERVAYYHLGAYTDRGYELGASFALFTTAIDYFRTLGMMWLNLGAGAGLQTKGNDGLSRFKRGWSTGTRTTYFCGRIFNKAAYNQILSQREASATTYFPAYRVGEFQ
jgi:hypothetical protein